MRLGLLKEPLWLLAALGCCAVPPSAHAQGVSRSLLKMVRADAAIVKATQL
jgi:hypothetical protein